VARAAVTGTEAGSGREYSPRVRGGPSAGRARGRRRVGRRRVGAPLRGVMFHVQHRRVGGAPVTGGGPGERGWPRRAAAASNGSRERARARDPVKAVAGRLR